MKKDTNLYDRLLILLVFLVGFGQIGGALQLSRIAAILVAPLLVTKYGGCRYAKGIAAGLGIFYAFCVFSLLWTPDRSEGIKEVLYYAVHLTLFMEIIVFARYANSPLKNISTGWLLAVLLCSGIAYWELTTGNHLDVSKEQKDYYNTGYEVLNFMRANATFYNYNDFAAFLCMAMPWLVYGLRDSNSGWVKRTAAILAVISSVIIILLNASRGGLVSIAIMAVIFFFMSAKGRSRWYSLLLLIPVVAVVYYLYNQSAFAVITARSSDGGLFEGEARYVIWYHAMQTLGDTFGLGTGIGGIEASMEKYAHGGITITHNLFIEIMLEFGVIVVVAFVVFLWRQFKRTLRLDSDRKMVLLMSLVAMPVYGIISSGYLLNAHLYVLMATIYVFASYERIKYPYGAVRTAA